jgi:adenylate cyclase
MTQESMKRKLVAILSADVVGYSRLIGEDEETTVRTLTTYRDVISSLIKDHKGRVVDSPGDNILAEFVSVVEALRCAWDVQQEIKARNRDLSENRRMIFRIGINLGDVIEEEDRIYGDGVNIAARLEDLAEEGGICISGTAYDHVKNKPPFRYENQGEQIVKNIKEPIRVYKVLMEKDADDLILDKKLELPKKPSIAVLPFVNISGDPGQEYLSDGITEEIITGLSKIPKIFVISRNSTFTYKGTPVKVQKVSEELGVQYILEGSVRKAGNRIRITAQLVDAIIGHHLWAERYDRNLGDIFAVQDEITMKILNALELRLTEGEQAILFRRGTNNLQVYLKFLQALNYGRNMNPEDNIKARRIFEDVISLEPNYAMAYIQLGATHMVDVWIGTTKSPKDSLRKADELSTKALSYDESLGTAYALLGHISVLMRDWEKGISLGQLAVELEPNGADSLAYLGMGLRFADRSEEAIKILGKAIRLNPIAPSWYLHNLALAYRTAGQYANAIEYAEKAIQRSPNSLISHIVLAQCYSATGREEEARAEAKEVLRINPNFSLDRFAKTAPYKNPEEKKQVIDSMRKVGLN